MTRVGFVLAGRTVGWLASWTYYRTLLRALAAEAGDRIEPVLFVGERTDEPLLDEFPPLELHRSRMLDGRTPGALARAAARGLLCDLPLGRLLRRAGIEVMSHSGHLGWYSGVATIGWVPDLQHRHFPELFDRRTLAFREARYRLLARFATELVVSSRFGERDLLELAPRSAGRTTVLPFVIEPVARERQPERPELESRYGFSGRYLYLPNQFWAHKNHEVVIDALELLGRDGREPLVLATGVQSDRRRPGHFAELMQRVSRAGLSERFRPLGVVPYEHVAALVRESVAVINPSLFEGWSTTVEEAKSAGKRVLLSDIPVHREQAPAGGSYFDPRDAEALAELMWVEWTRNDPDGDRALAERAAAELPERRRRFVETYEGALARALERS
jgi:glycosyltransferase involved in cell wall biosynthesis